MRGILLKILLINLEAITTYDKLYDNKRLKQGEDFQVFRVPQHPGDRKKATQGDYKRFEQDPAYTKIVMYVGN